MNVNDLLKKKLQADASYPYKYDRKSGHYYRTDQVRLEFPAGTSFQEMKAWVNYYSQLAHLQDNTAHYSTRYYSNGNCVVTGSNMGIFATPTGSGTSIPPPPPPKPQIWPISDNVINPSLTSIRGKMELFAISTNDLATVHAQLLTETD